MNEKQIEIVAQYLGKIGVSDNPGVLNCLAHEIAVDVAKFDKLNEHRLVDLREKVGKVIKSIEVGNYFQAILYLELIDEQLKLAK